MLLYVSTVLIRFKLVDMNIVPADVMSDMGAKKIIAVDVSSEEKADFFEYGTELSGLWLLYNSWNPFVQTVSILGWIRLRSI